MRKITVMSSSGNQNEFFGEALRYTVHEDGSLLVTGWETGDERGQALFPAGKWDVIRFLWPNGVR